MKLERTHDMELVRQIMAHPRVWRHVHEDNLHAPAPVDADFCHWMLVLDPDPIGVYLTFARSAICWEMHTFLTPAAWGGKANQAIRLLGDYIFYELGGQKVTTWIPAFNRAALRYARSNGMSDEGNNRASFLRDGVLHDQFLLGITLKEFESCQQQ